MQRIQLFGKYSEGKFLLVDDEDFKKVNQYKWHCTNKGYVVRLAIVGYKDLSKPKYDWNCITKTILVHRFIMDAPNNKEVDHWDNNKLNNQKYNLRICTSQQNKFNSRKHKNNKSGIKGVYLKGDGTHKTKPWEAKIHVDGKDIHLGYYMTKEEAGMARKEAEKKYHGEFAKLEKVDNTVLLYK